MNLLEVGEEKNTDLLDLLARIYCEAMKGVLSKGLNRDYVVVENVLPGIKGKVDFETSLKRSLLRQGIAACSYDEFKADILPNQILKSILLRLLRTDGLAKSHGDELLLLYRRMPEVSTIPLQEKSFGGIRLGRNNRHYDLPLKIAQLIYRSTLPTENEGAFSFADFLRDEKSMANVFEEFVRKFYQVHVADKFTQIGREYIQWQLMEVKPGSQDLIPRMETDISLENEHQKLIIDTKYYKDALSGYHGTGNLHSANLYQLYAYLRNQENIHIPKTMECEGMLLYPTNGTDLDESFSWGSHKIRICTLNLNQEWKGIHDCLMGLVGDFERL
jgi:5-methylcytosine-specific restriction enzyme subunit McrC